MKKIALLLSALMLVALVSTSAFAATQKEAKVHTMFTHVLKIDTKADTITFKGTRKDYTLKAEPQLLAGITVGDHVKIEASNGVLKSIKKLQAKTTKETAATKPAETPAQAPAKAAPAN